MLIKWSNKINFLHSEAARCCSLRTISMPNCIFPFQSPVYIFKKKKTEKEKNSSLRDFSNGKSVACRSQKRLQGCCWDL